VLTVVWYLCVVYVYCFVYVCVVGGERVRNFGKVSLSIIGYRWINGILVWIVWGEMESKPS